METRTSGAERGAEETMMRNHHIGASASTLREADPSDEDTKLTKLLFEAGNILGITLLDHIIFTPTQFFSFRDNRMHTVSNNHPTKKGGETA